MLALAALPGALCASDASDAAACHTRGMAAWHSSGQRGLEAAAPLLERAVRLDRGNVDYLADYGHACLLLAQRHRSLFYAVRGRDALERAVAIDPGQIDCHIGLMEFFAIAPWPLGSVKKAFAHAAAIAAVDRVRGVAAYLELQRICERDRRHSAAREACLDALRLDPGNALAKRALAELPES